jgi:hypothetical protein
LAVTPDPLTAALGFVDALALGRGDALGLGVTLAWATPASMRVLAAVTVITAGQRPMPDGLFHVNVGPPQQTRHRHHDALPRTRGADLFAMTTMSLVHRYVDLSVCVCQGRKVATYDVSLRELLTLFVVYRVKML